MEGALNTDLVMLLIKIAIQQLEEGCKKLAEIQRISGP